MIYDTVEYAQSRLLGTVVKLCGRGVLVVDCLSKDRVLVGELLSPNKSTSYVNLNDLDFSPIKLGYVNHLGEAHYLERKPMRADWRQGLRRNNVNNPNILEVGIVQLLGAYYPSLEEACSLVDSGERLECAFSRTFSVGCGLSVMHKGRGVVGKVENGVVVLDNMCQYLMEALKEVV